MGRQVVMSNEAKKFWKQSNDEGVYAATAEKCPCETRQDCEAKGTSPVHVAPNTEYKWDMTWRPQ